MALENLVTSQPEEEVSLPSQDEIAMDYDEYGDEASGTPVNSDGGESIEEASQEDDGNSRYQKRIDKLTARAKQAEEDRIRLEAKLEAIENMQKPQSEKTLDEFTSSELKEIIHKAEQNDETDPELLQQAKDLYVEKLVEERTSNILSKKDRERSVQEGVQMTNLMVENLTGKKINDTTGEYYMTAEQYLKDLNSEQFTNINKDHLLAAALTEIEYLKKNQNGPSMSQRVIKNRNIPQVNNHAANIGGSQLESILKENNRLETSRQGATGSLGKAIRELGVVKSFERT